MKTKTFKLEMTVDINEVTFPADKSQFDEANQIIQSIKNFIEKYNSITNRRSRQFTNTDITQIKSLSITEI